MIIIIIRMWCLTWVYLITLSNTWTENSNKCVTNQPSMWKENKIYVSTSHFTLGMLNVFFLHLYFDR